MWYWEIEDPVIQWIVYEITHPWTMGIDLLYGLLVLTGLIMLVITYRRRKRA